MAEEDSLSGFDFSKISKPGKFLKFEAGKSVTVRILTKDPVVQEKEFTAKNGDVNLSTKFCFIVWNFTAEKAQILTATPKMATTFQRVATDDDFGSNLQKCDIKINVEGEMLERVYDINVLRHSGNEKELTKAMIEEAQKLNLDDDVQDNRGRLSRWEPVDESIKPSSSGYEQAKEQADRLRKEDEVIEDIGDEPINLDDIPF
jgi:hypothetical protein